MMLLDVYIKVCLENSEKILKLLIYEAVIIPKIVNIFKQILMIFKISF